MLWLVTIPNCSLLMHLCKEPSQSSLKPCVPLKDYKTAVKFLTCSRLNHPRTPCLPLVYLVFHLSNHLRGPWWTSSSLLIPLFYLGTQKWAEYSRCDHTNVTQMGKQRYFPQPVSWTPVNASEHAARLHSLNSHSSCSPSGSPGPLLQKTWPARALPVKANGSLAWKCGLAFLCAELEIFVNSSLREVRSPLSSSPALLLSSAPLNLLSSDHRPRLHAVLFSKLIYRII